MYYNTALLPQTGLCRLYLIVWTGCSSLNASFSSWTDYNRVITILSSCGRNKTVNDITILHVAYYTRVVMDFYESSILFIYFISLTEISFLGMACTEVMDTCLGIVHLENT